MFRSCTCSLNSIALVHRIALMLYNNKLINIADPLLLNYTDPSYSMLKFNLLNWSASNSILSKMRYLIFNWWQSKWCLAFALYRIMFYETTYWIFNFLQSPLLHLLSISNIILSNSISKSQLVLLYIKLFHIKGLNATVEFPKLGV